jgi:hypothetical protein
VSAGRTTEQFVHDQSADQAASGGEHERGRPARALQEAAGNQATAALLQGDAPLTPSARATLERAYGVDLGSVRVHSGPAAAAEARSQDALAFTRGGDVYLGTSNPHVLAHELAHTVQQVDAGRERTLSTDTLEAEAHVGGEVTVGGAAPGAVQKFDFKWFWENDEEKKPQDPDLTQRLLDDLRVNKDAWKQHLDDPASAEIMRAPGIIRDTYEKDPDFKEWLENPKYRPAGSTAAAKPQGWSQQMEAGRQATAAEDAQQDRASKAADLAKKLGKTPPAKPPEDWAKAQERMSLRQRAKSTYEQGTAPKKQMEDAKRGPLSTFIGKHERELLEVEHAVRMVPILRAVVPLDQAVTAEDIIGRKVDRTHAAVEGLSEIVLDASMFVSPESLMELGVAPEETLAEAAMSRDVTGTTTGMTKELEANIAAGEELGPEVAPMEDVFEPTATPQAEIPPEAEARARSFEHSDIVDPGRKPSGFEPTGYPRRRPVPPEPFEELETTAHEKARRPRGKGPTREQQIEGLLETKESETAREEFEAVRDAYAQVLNVDKGGNVHHAIELQVLDRYPGAYTSAELNGLENMRGIPKAENPELHLSLIRKSWDHYYAELDEIILREGLQKNTPEYNLRVRAYLERARDKVDFVASSIFTGSGVP